MGIKEVLDAFKDYGIGGTLLACFLLLTLAIIKSNWASEIMTKLFDKIVEYFSKKKSGEDTSKVKIKSINESDILNHDIFNYIDFWIHSKIPTFQFSTDYRTIVFRKYLTVFLKKHKDKIRSYVDKKEFETMENAQLWTSLLSLINDIIYDYEREMESNGIPKIVIEKMKVKNNDTISLTIDLIEGVCNSQFYDSEKNLLKVYSILNIMLSILENTISNSSLICNSINGQLRGMKISENGREYTEP